ncbi:extracellular solute-binding protein [Nonomuraea sp. NPDC050310]|uniref:extracellular solute-binding protein n=1 Tax=unclassified Nonomuraea TaxID=2593643 RepID=UPI0033E91B5D
MADRRTVSGMAIAPLVWFAATLLVLGFVPAVAWKLGHREECPRPAAVRVAMAPDVSADDIWRTVIAAYRGAEVQVTEVSEVADLMTAELRADGASRCPGYDVYALDVAATAEFAAAGLLDPYPGKLTGLVGDLAEGGSWDRIQYGVPFAADVGLLYRRPDLPEPRSWAELWATGETLAAQLADYEGGTVNLLELAGDLAAARTADDNEQFGGSWSWREGESLAAFAQGRTGYLRHWPYAYHRLRAQGVPFEVSALPGTPALGGTNLAVAAGSGKAQEARAFIEYLLSPEVQRRLFACGGYPPVVAAAYTDVRPCDLPRPADAADPPDRERLSAFAELVKGQLERAERPKLEHYPEYGEAYRRCLTLAVREKEPEGMADVLAGARAGRMTGGEACG